MILVLFAGLALITLSNRSPLHPAAVSFLMRSEIENIECREGSGSGSVLDAPGATRTGNFSLSGSFECYRPVFRSDERNPYIDRALAAELARAKRVALSLARQIEGRDTGPIAVEVEGLSEADLREDIEAIYRTELSAVLGAGRVRRMTGADATTVLSIRMRRVDVPELMSTARLKLLDKKGEIKWLDI